MEKERLYYIDWLRVMVVLSLIPYHSALPYTELGDIYIRTPLHDIRVLPFLFITVPLRSFFMTLLFFVSGIATYYSFKYRTKNEYIVERFRKIFIPLAIGTVMISPIQAYFKALYEGFSGSIIEFVPEFFSSKIDYYLGYAHFWYLLYLFVFSLLCLPLFSNWFKNQAKLIKLSQLLCKGNNIYIPILFIIIAEMILRPFFPGPQTLIGDWANDIVYLCVFIYGFVYASDKKIQERVNKLANSSKVVFSVLLIMYISIEYLLMTEGETVSFLAIILDLSKGLYECTAIIVLLWLGKKYLNKKSPVLSYLNKASFPFYIVHFVPVCMFTYLFVNANINVYAKYMLVVLLAYLLTFFFYEMFIRRFSPDKK